LSVEAVHVSVIDVVVAALRLSPVGVDGAVESGQALVVPEMVLRVERLPTASNASRPNVYVVPHESPVKVYDVLVVSP